MTKITLFSPDGTAEVFVDCEIEHELAPELVFTGVNAFGNRIKRMTTRQYDIDVPMPEPVQQKGCNG